MINNITKHQELNFTCPCCGEQINIEITESGELIITPFILPEIVTDVEGYEFGEARGGETNE